MHFNILKSIEILERTPDTVKAMLDHISPDWTTNNEGDDTWSVFDIMGHLIHGEKTDWIARAKIILSDKPPAVFEPFDRFAQFKDSKGKTMTDMLTTFGELRKSNLQTLRSMHLSEKDFERTGMHPAFGEVTLAQLLATWTVHDLNHIAQIARVMAKQYAEAVGPWSAYLGILNRP